MKHLLTHITSESGTLGAVVSAAGLGCVTCFPLLANIAAAVGLGFLVQWQGLFTHILVPLLAAAVLLANAFGWFRHRQWWRSVLGMLGPALVLLALYALWYDDWRNPVLYAGLGIMVAVALWGLVSPGYRRCATGSRRRTVHNKGAQP